MDSRASWQERCVCVCMCLEAWRPAHGYTDMAYVRLSSSNNRRDGKQKARGDLDGEQEGVDSVDWTAVIQLPQQWGPFASTATCHAAVKSRSSRPLLVGHGHPSMHKGRFPTRKDTTRQTSMAHPSSRDATASPTVNQASRHCQKKQTSMRCRRLCKAGECSRPMSGHTTLHTTCV